MPNTFGLHVDKLAKLQRHMADGGPAAAKSHQLFEDTMQVAHAQPISVHSHLPHVKRLPITSASLQALPAKCISLHDILLAHCADSVHDRIAARFGTPVCQRTAHGRAQAARRHHVLVAGTAKGTHA